MTHRLVPNLSRGPRGPAAPAPPSLAWRGVHRQHPVLGFSFPPQRGSCWCDPELDLFFCTGEGWEEREAGGGPTSLWGGTASPTAAGTVTPIEDAAVTGGCSMVPHPLAPTPAWPALHRGVPQFPHLAVLPPSSSGMPGQTDATSVGARRVSGAAQAPAGVEAPILSPGRSGRTGLEPGWGSGTALASQPRGGTPGELLARSCPAKSRRDHEFVGRRLGPWRSAEHHTGDAAPPALVPRQPLCLASVHQRAPACSSPAAG